MIVRELQEPRGWAFVLGACLLRPLCFLTTKPVWVGGTTIPATGGCVVVINHLSHVDPLTAAVFCHDHGRLPRYLAKAELFENKALGVFLRAAGQIPVHRASRTAVGAYDAAVAAVRDGQCVVVYPEGTITRDPGLWPMKGKSGAARIALETGCPVVPIGQWGAQALLAPYARRPDLVPRKTVEIRVGTPVDLTDLADRPRSAEALTEATDRIMAAITSIVEDIRGETAPSERFDPRRAGVAETGDPRRPRKTPPHPRDRDIA